jgi:hypothetical protein
MAGHPAYAEKCCVGGSCTNVGTSCAQIGAQSCENNPNICSANSGATDDIFGKVKPPPGVSRFGNFNQGLIPFANIILRAVFIIAGLYAFINIIMAGFQYLSAGGDPKAIGHAWEKIWQSFVGLLILVASFLLAALVGIIFFGDPMFILNPKITGAP